MTIRRKLSITVCALSAIIIGMFVATFWVIRQQRFDGLLINLAGRQRMLTQKMTKETLFLCTQARKTGQIDADQVKTIRTTASVFEKTLLALKDSGEAPLTVDPATTTYRFCPQAQGPIRERLDAGYRLWQDYARHLETVLAAPAQGEEGLAWIMANNMALLKTMDEAVERMQRQSEAKVSLLLGVQVSSILIGLAVGIWALITTRSIVRRLQGVQVFAERLGQGDLGARLSLKGNDELGRIGAVLDQTADQLGVMIQRMNDNARSLGDASGTLVTIARDMATGAEDVSNRSNGVAAATEQMSSNMSAVAAAIEETTTNVTVVSTAADQMTGAIREIAQSTERATSITQAAVGDARTASEMVNHLGQAAREITKVTETITEISEQTNLLALNATIEAARAGEAGKGFAVVANEIKDLANQTAEATEDIRKKIDGIQRSTTQTVSAIDQISRVITEVNDIVTTIASAVEEQSATTQEIAQSVTQASQGIQEVNSNVAQASTVAGSVAKDIAGVHQVAQNVAHSSGNVKTHAQSLADLSSELKHLVEQYR